VVAPAFGTLRTSTFVVLRQHAELAALPPRYDHFRRLVRMGDCHWGIPLWYAMPQTSLRITLFRRVGATLHS